MPVYVYECLVCHNKFDKLMPNFETGNRVELLSCPHCKGNVKRIQHTVGMPIMKGPGFYNTEYRNKAKEKIPNPS